MTDIDDFLVDHEETLAKTREVGFYWIEDNYDSFPDQIGRWTGFDWKLTGIEESFPALDFSAISDKLILPDELEEGED